jgi:hypothetical protein
MSLGGHIGNILFRVPQQGSSFGPQYRARQTGGTGPLQPGRRHVKAIFNEMKGAYR